MSVKIDIQDGWWPLLEAAIDEGMTYPQEWMFEITGASRREGVLLLTASYNSPDVRTDPSAPHPFRAFIDLRERARLRSLDTCEVCGAVGRLRGSGEDARVRCDEHEGVHDA